MVFVPQSGIDFTNAKEMSAFAAPASQLLIYDDTTVAGSDAAGFWTEIAEVGVADDTNYVANTPKIIASITGSGRLADVIGPTANGTTNYIIVITNDGVQYTFNVQAPSGSRPVISRGGLGVASEFSTSAVWVQYASDLNAGKNTFTTVVNRHLIPLDVMLRNYPLLRFQVSLSVSIQTDTNISGTGSQERQSGVRYHLVPA